MRALPVRCNRDASFKTFEDLVVFSRRIAGSDTPFRTERLQALPQKAGCQLCKKGFVGVTANIADCRSVDKGSTPLRTANIVW